MSVVWWWEFDILPDGLIMKNLCTSPMSTNLHSPNSECAEGEKIPADRPETLVSRTEFSRLFRSRHLKSEGRENNANQRWNTVRALKWFIRTNEAFFSRDGNEWSLPCSRTIFFHIINYVNEDKFCCSSKHFCPEWFFFLRRKGSGFYALKCSEMINDFRSVCRSGVRSVKSSAAIRFFQRGQR